MGEVRKIREQQSSEAPNSKSAQALEILDFLNERAGKNFRPVFVNLEFIRARLDEGYTLEDCKQVVAMKVREWRGDPYWRKFLRPETLFNRTKFSQYVGEIGSE